MSIANSLPKVEKKKKVNIKKLESLAERVRKYFIQEQEYLEKKKKIYGNNKARKLIFTS